MSRSVTFPNDASGRDAGDGQALGPDDGSETETPLCLDALYRNESPRLLRSMARRTSSREEALDLVHDLFVRLARLGKGGAAGLARPEAYLSRMATNLLRDRARTAASHHSDRHATGRRLPSETIAYSAAVSGLQSRPRVTPRTVPGALFVPLADVTTSGRQSRPDAGSGSLFVRLTTVLNPSR